MRAALVTIAFLAAAACQGQSPGAERMPIGGVGAEGRQLALPAQAQLDSGNVAFHVGDHQGALRHYEEATRLAPDQAAGWFGVYMAHNAMGNRVAADSAMQRVQALAPEAEWQEHPHPPREGDAAPGSPGMVNPHTSPPPRM